MSMFQKNLHVNNINTIGKVWFLTTSYDFWQYSYDYYFEEYFPRNGGTTCKVGQPGQVSLYDVAFIEFRPVTYLFTILSRPK